jgi:hypothetical protein
MNAASKKYRRPHPWTTGRLVAPSALDGWERSSHEPTAQEGARISSSIQARITAQVSSHQQTADWRSPQIPALIARAARPRQGYAAQLMALGSQILASVQAPLPPRQPQQQRLHAFWTPLAGPRIPSARDGPGMWVGGEGGSGGDRVTGCLRLGRSEVRLRVSCQNPRAQVPGGPRGRLQKKNPQPPADAGPATLPPSLPPRTRAQPSSPTNLPQEPAAIP